jgi:peptidoglycan/LPS O-acetylase OafA/YrhL
MIQTWYLAADMQLHLLAPLLLYPIWRWPQRAFKLLIIFVVTSTVIPFLYIYITKALPFYMIGAQ